MKDFTVMHSERGNLLWIRANNDEALMSLRGRYCCEKEYAKFADYMPFRPEDLPDGFTYEIQKNNQ
jgi:hypothetical protein